MTNATTAQIEEALTTWQSMSRIQSPAYFAASMMSDAQEAIDRELWRHAIESLAAARYLLARDGRHDWEGQVWREEVKLRNRQSNDVVIRTALMSMAIDGLNAIKREIFRGIENGSIR